MMDLSGAWQVKSDRLNADDMIGATPTVTIKTINWPNNSEPCLHLDQYPGRPWYPSAGMGRVMREVWGANGADWVGRRVTLFHKPDVEFNKERTGGIRILAMSHMDRPRTFEVKESRSKRVKYKIDPLPDSTPTAEVQPDWRAEIEARAGDVDALRAMWSDAQARGASQAVLNDIKAAATVATDNTENKEN